MLLSYFCFFLNVLFSIAQDEPDKQVIDVDYYGRGFVRHSRVYMDCNVDLHRQYCRFKCSRSHAVCIEGNCYCLKGDESGLLPSKEPNQPEDLPSESSEEELQPLNMESKPILRHHIAHFCPDLELARQCIRKCQKEGKPAFCGKDHNCYCGHKYNSWNKNEKIDVKAMYAQFKDLYDKYFGRPTTQPPRKEKKPHIPNNHAENAIKDNDVVVAQSAENKPTDGDNNADAAKETATEAGGEPAADENKPAGEDGASPPEENGEAQEGAHEGGDAANAETPADAAETPPETPPEEAPAALRNGDVIRNLLKAVLRQGLGDEYDD